MGTKTTNQSTASELIRNDTIPDSSLFSDGSRWLYGVRITHLVR